MLTYKEFSEIEIQTFYRHIAYNVQRIRKIKKVTQLDLALTIGHKSVSTIAKIEAGLENKHYNIEHLYKIAIALDVDICDFFRQPHLSD